jgi:hypothetical protein
MVIFSLALVAMMTTTTSNTTTKPKQPPKAMAPHPLQKLMVLALFPLSITFFFFTTMRQSVDNTDGWGWGEGADDGAGDGDWGW